MEDGTRQLVGWQSLAEAIPGGVAIQREDTLAYVSERAGSLLGVDTDDAVDGPWADPFASEERDRLASALETARDGERWTGTVHPAGRDTPVTVTLSPTSEGAIVWTLTDDATGAPTDHEAADADDRQVAEFADDADATAETPDAVADRPASILASIEDGVYVLDEDARFAYVNPAMGALVDRAPADLLGQPAMTIFEADDDRSIARRLRERAISGDGRGTLRATITTDAGERTLEGRYRLLEPAADEFRGSVGVVRDVTELERDEGGLRTGDRFLQNVVDAMEDVLYVIDADDNFVFWNDVAEERFGYTAAEFADLHPLAFDRRSDPDEAAKEAFDITEIPDRYRRDLVTKDGEVIPHELQGVTYRDAATDELYLVGVARDISDQLERERELERQRDELATLDRINELILETVQELLTSASRDAVERSVCDRLASSDLYQFAWVGEPELDGDRIAPRVIAGDERGYLEDVTITDDETETGKGPIGRAMRTGEVQVANVADPAFARWREAARARDVESVLAAPLNHGDTVYGVLAVYANREDAFSARERAAFDALGRTVGFVFHAERSRELLFADEVIELEFALRTSESMFGNAGPALDCSLDLAGYVASGESWILYVEADDVDPHEMADYANEDPIVDAARVIDETETGGRLEVVVGHSDLLETVSAAGATVRSATATPDSARLVIEAPIGADVRDVVEIVTREYTGADLIARRERDREITTAARPEGLLEDLTERQQGVLETAYRSGYFDWPRESTAEEVAVSLDVAPATLHGHLRKAEKAVLSALFERP